MAYGLAGHVGMPQLQLQRTAQLPSSALCPCVRVSRCVRPCGRLQSTDPGAGDSSVQNTLEDMVRVQIEKEELKAMVLEEREKLRLTGEEAREELEKLEELSRARSELAFGAALADINREADEFEAQLRASRERMEADRAEFKAWEHKTARDRSAGHFFQSLYQSDAGTSEGSSLSTVEEAAARGEPPRAEAQAEAALRRSPRPVVVLYSILAAALSAAVCQGVPCSEGPGC